MWQEQSQSDNGFTPTYLQCVDRRGTDKSLFHHVWIWRMLNILQLRDGGAVGKVSRLEKTCQSLRLLHKAVWAKLSCVKHCRSKLSLIDFQIWWERWDTLWHSSTQWLRKITSEGMQIIRAGYTIYSWDVMLWCNNKGKTGRKAAPYMGLEVFGVHDLILV